MDVVLDVVLDVVMDDDFIKYSDIDPFKRRS